jgi:hypothetical protein
MSWLQFSIILFLEELTHHDEQEAEQEQNPIDLTMG